MFSLLYDPTPSHPYMTTGKTIALTVQPFVGKVMSLLFNALSRFVITFFQGTSVFYLPIPPGKEVINFYNLKFFLSWSMSMSKYLK